MNQVIVVSDDMHHLTACFLRELALMTGGPSPLEVELGDQITATRELMGRVVDKLNEHADPGTRFGEMKPGAWGWMSEEDEDEQEQENKSAKSLVYKFPHLDKAWVVD